MKNRFGMYFPFKDRHVVIQVKILDERLGEFKVRPKRGSGEIWAPKDSVQLLKTPSFPTSLTL